ncbi:AbrB/MazE/SpoVT family DNA-binding domain-containing protein [Stutzerimonas stutzeri]|uniref:AbrB/MazE/SpoVT family DNA-binding domain-containing protein n=1 Tax=Stutzerimonas stutzeri TaxID=316 RepID=UPI0005685F25|nr:AbrB/MazE/SpoVT family DNA-binding domain-containing protein [Stutzerimonas stutzeri]MCF6753083.1 AbrB/MazE/SpoVT family DNA-binding domain-containing protein [Stutzerimonas stutzeri]
MTTTPESWRVVCQDPGDGSGDVIVELPSELLEQLGWSLGDKLSVEAGEENVCLKLKQRAGAYSCGNPDNV